MKTTAKKRRTAKAKREPRKTAETQDQQENAGTARGRGRNTLGRAYDWAYETAGNAHLPSFRMPRMPGRQDLAQLAEANPLLLGAVGLGLGVAIATMFPRGMGVLRRQASSRGQGANGSPARKTAGRKRGGGRRGAKARAGAAN